MRCWDGEVEFEEWDERRGWLQIPHESLPVTATAILDRAQMRRLAGMLLRMAERLERRATKRRGR